MGICCSATGYYSMVDIRNVQTDNINSHNTFMYNWPGLIFRRGIPFYIEIPYLTTNHVNESDVSIKLILSGCDEKKILLNKSGTNLECEGWSFTFPSIRNVFEKISICMISPACAPVGKYVLNLCVLEKEIGSAEFILFFNPWCKEDDVYMPNTDAISEYLLSDYTKIYMGTEEYIVPKDWDLGQFEPGCIEASIMLLDRMPVATRSNPVNVSRQLSALINANDDNGVVMGNWSGKYFDGTSPMNWTGSTNILTKYSQTGRAVRYGQCWVFSGVLCTVLRTIGIPARCITNYASLHDTDGSLKWEIYLDSNFNPINNGGDSCWNFHCWNEAWMRRTDLDKCHDGWQVLDSTPQERSGGLFRLGPASKYAVRKGLLKTPYDVGFVYAEVNADKVFYLRQPDGTFKNYMVKKNELGRLVVTKKKLSEEIEDITNEYKCIQNSTMASLIDDSHSEMRSTEDNTSRKININIDVAKFIYLTESLTGLISVSGLSDKKFSIIKIQALLVSYTGRNICKLYEVSEKVKESHKTFDFKVGNDILESSITEEFPCIRLKVYCFDSNNDEMAFAEKNISVKTPDIQIMGIPTTASVDSTVACTVAINNTLNHPLTHVRLNIKFTDDKLKRLKINSIPAGTKLQKIVTVVPKTVGLKKVHISLESRECCGFSSVAKFNATW